MSSRKGLVSYTGDSEISDSEDERVSAGSTPPSLAANTLGIPPSKPRQPTTPPSFVKPVVHSAPSTGLVDYYAEEEDELNESKGVEGGLEDVFDNSSSALGDTGGDGAKISETVPVIEVVDEPQVESGAVDNNSEETTPLFLPIAGIQLPPEPPGRCSNALRDKITAFLQKKDRLGIGFNENVQKRKDIRNPSIYEKLVQKCKLDEFGTNYPEHLFNPHEWTEESFYDNLQKAQKKAYEKKEKAKLERTKIEFVTGTKRPAAPASTAQDPQKKQRKSKWDISTSADSGGSRGASPSKEKSLGVGAQALAQAKLAKELSKLAK